MLAVKNFLHRATLTKGPKKLLLFTFKVEILLVLQITMIKLSVNKTNWSQFVSYEPYSHSLDLDLNLNTVYLIRTRKITGTLEQWAPDWAARDNNIREKKEKKTPLQTLHILNFFFFIILAFDVGAFQHVCAQVYFFLDTKKNLHWYKAGILKG